MRRDPGRHPVPLLRALWRRATYRAGPSWYDRHPIAEQTWQWLILDAERRVLDGGLLKLAEVQPQRVASWALVRFLDARGLTGPAAAALTCAARRPGEPARIGVARAAISPAPAGRRPKRRMSFAP